MPKTQALDSQIGHYPGTIQGRDTVLGQKSSRMACLPPKLITISAIELRTLGSQKF